MTQVVQLTAEEVSKLLQLTEGHFLDMKAKEIQPSKLSRSISAFANADGGELLVGVREVAAPASWRWDGFANQEAANGHVQLFERLFPLGGDFSYEFLSPPSEFKRGLVLRIGIQKTREVKKASDGTPYIRRGAQNLPVTSPHALANLQRAKGILSHEDTTLAGVEQQALTNSLEAIHFMLNVVPDSEPGPWLQKQRLIIGGKPTVCGVLLFSDEPQAYIPKATVKIYRYKTTDMEGTREHLAFDPIAVEGPLYHQIHQAVEKTVELAEQIQIMTEGGLQPIQYPHESLHEIITNAVIHRDYAIHDDVHVRIFDNRVEVESPGRLPAHITPANILQERFARNPKIVRLLNKFPNPPNKDVGEGLNTAFRAMKKLRLRDPQILERENMVLVLIRHETLASPEQQIIEYTRKHGTINNSAARDVTGIESEIKVRKLFKKLMRAGEIEQVPGTFKATTAYRIPEGR